MKTNKALVEYLRHIGVLQTPAVISAFKKVDRKLFIPEHLRDLAYSDSALPIGAGQTISQPYVVAFMLELLDAHKGDRVLDVGSGSGYTTALLATIVGPRGRVLGVEIVHELVEYGRRNLRAFHFPHAEIRQAANKIGLPREAPFDRILVSASAPDIPNALIAQLTIGGRMVAPVRDAIVSVTKETGERLSIETHPGFAFVPLVG
ncbi:protein-L-isoaspartate(D-aspartate) O-methyltransferase [Candidatus Kaiserbacteria bacterium]|nr:protein-L-isoaspartate(D-aspartate) O-methyltransferase [Candidatus Kaiserbacteria bacterium]